MHPAPAFREADVAPLTQVLQACPFVTLAASVEGRALVAHAPVVVRQAGGGLALEFHLSRRNALAPHLRSGSRILAVSLAADAYVSPDWYGAPDQVPTWNYVSVEAEGPLEVLEELELVRLLDDLSAQEEKRLFPKAPWSRAKMSPGRFEAMLPAIVGARIRVERLEGTFKLSQNKPAAAQAGVREALGDRPIAGWMGQNGPH